MELNTPASDNGSDSLNDNPSTRNRTTNTTNRRNHRARTSESSPPQSVSHPIGTTRRGLPRQRMTWSTDMNVAVITAFHKASCCGQITSGYGQKMFGLFIHEYPQLSHLTLQNIIDRKNAILRRNLLPRQTIEQIRIEIENNNNNDSTDPEMESQQVTIDHSATPPETTNTSTGTPNSQNDAGIETSTNTPMTPHEIELKHKLLHEYTSARSLYGDLQAQNRPYLPRQRASHKLSLLTRIFDKYILPPETGQMQNLTDLTASLYCSAVAIIKVNGGKIHEAGNTNNIQHRTPHWQLRLENKIANLRKDIGLLTKYKEGRVTTRRSINKAQRVMEKYRIHSRYNPPNTTVEEVLDTLKQKLKVYTDRQRSYLKSYARKNDNKQFARDQRLFYRNLKNNTSSYPGTSVTYHNLTDTHTFWKELWETCEEHNRNESWLTIVKNQTNSIQQMNSHQIVMEDLKELLKKLHNWKQAGPDKIHNFWLKHLTNLHGKILLLINECLINPSAMPSDMPHGITYLKAKVDNPSNPSQYRPITCLNTMYKLITSAITKLITKHCDRNSILHEQQKGCRSGTYGCKEHLVIDSAILKYAANRNRNMHAAFIDYRKAYDKVPHSWLLHVLELYKIDPQLIHFLQVIMSNWKTNLQLSTPGTIERIGPISFRRGIYQGDPLSALWFCIAMNPLSTLLDDSKYGFSIKYSENERCQITHGFYMDDLKIYTETKEKLKQMLKIVDSFSSDIKMEFGTDKCKIQSMVRGKFAIGNSFTTEENEIIQPLQQNEIYKYLGIAQSVRIDHTTVKLALQTEFERRLKLVLKSGLNSKNMTKAVNSFAIPVLLYSFGVIKWSPTDLEHLNMKLRTTLTQYKHHHPKSAIQRVNIPRSQGGRGFVDIQALHNKQVGRIKNYFISKAAQSNIHNAITNIDDNLTPLDLCNRTQLPIIRTVDELKQEWREKPLHGKFPTLIDSESIDKNLSFAWLKDGKLFPETEGFAIAIQDEVITTKHYKKYILRDDTVTDDRCRRCKQDLETLEHIMNGCVTLTQSKYKERHDNVGKILHQSILRKLEFPQDNTPYYNYQPAAVLENRSHKIYWDRAIYTDNHGNASAQIHNRPDLIIIDKNNKKATIIDIAIPTSKNITKTYQTKIQKYQQLCRHMVDNRNITTTKIVPVIVSSTGVIPKTTTEAIRDLELNPFILKLMQKAVLINTTTIVREFLNITEI